MKYLLPLLLAAVVVWRWRSATHTPRAPTPHDTSRNPAVVNMTACAHCGLHLPMEDMVQGAHGLYCSQAHRTLAEPS